jgi:NaMN:DMB phosphoribosyltransferase
MSTDTETATTLEARAFQTESAPHGALRPSAGPRRRLLKGVRQRLRTVGEVVLDGLVSGLAAAAAVALIGAGALTLSVLLLRWWF